MLDFAGSRMRHRLRREVVEVFEKEEIDLWPRAPRLAIVMF